MIAPRSERHGEIRKRRVHRRRRRIGGRKTIVQEFPNLPSALPSRLIVKGARYGEVPDTLRSRITFAMGTDILGDLVNPKTLPYASINNHRVTLSFRPATTADEDALKSLLPTGEITDLNQLPKSIPSYLISVIPELKVEGEVVLSGSPMRLGEDLPLAFQLINPSSQSRIYQSPIVAGSYLAFAGIGGSVSSQKLSELKAKLESTKTKLESQDQTAIASLTREDLLGDMFHAGVLGYYAEYLALGHLAGLSQKNHVQLMPSAGTYGYVPEVSYLFGFPRAIIPGGVEMDLDAVATATSTDGKDKTAWKNFNFQMGALSSALEHAIPEQMFVTPENPGEGVSAVKALQKAAQQGQRIYHITQANMATALPNLHFHPETMDEIRQALSSGKEVITHTDPISVPGWSGAGYVIADPETGAGAWKIGGGLNGGWYTLVAVAVVAIIAVALPVLIAHMFLMIAMIALLVLTTALALFFGPDFTEYKTSLEWIGFIVGAFVPASYFVKFATLMGSMSNAVAGVVLYVAGVIAAGFHQMGK